VKSYRQQNAAIAKLLQYENKASVLENLQQRL